MVPFGGPGAWSLSSKSDPRWNKSGSSSFMTVTSGMCKEAKDMLELLKEAYGELPEDLTYFCCKD